jgi:V/A-type H+-transporting ATPase subunit K
MMKMFRWLMAMAMASPAFNAVMVQAAETSASTQHSSDLRTVGLGAAAATAVSLCVLGAGYAVGRIGSAAMGAAAEKPELLTRSLIFVALAEGLAVLGFAIAMMLLQKI